MLVKAQNTPICAYQLPSYQIVALSNGLSHIYSECFSSSPVVKLKCSFTFFAIKEDSCLLSIYGTKLKRCLLSFS